MYIASECAGVESSDSSEDRPSAQRDPTQIDPIAHVAWIDEFCLHCGADLRVRRVLIPDGRISADAKLLFDIARAVEHAGFYGSFETQADRDLVTALALTSEDRQRLADLYGEGCETVRRVFCGIGAAEFVGITADGVFLYAAMPDVSNAG